MTEPKCLNEIPLQKRILMPSLLEEVNKGHYVAEEYDYDEFDKSPQEIIEDVQRLVCRRIIFLERPNVEEDEVTIKDYKYLFNITDAMIEGERKRMKG